MSKRRISILGSADRGHVSTYAPYRICRLFLATVLLAFPVFGEAEQGIVAELTEEAELYKDASPGAESFGLLPKGTLLRLLGDQQGGFVSVEVELQSGSIEGWVYRNRLNLEEQAREELLEEKKPRKSKPAPTLAPRSRRAVPKDEELLLRRKPTFFYGANAGGLYCIIRSSVDGDQFTGMGFSVGGHLGFYLDKNIPLRIEVDYASLNGVGVNLDPASFGFFNVGASVAYHINDLELFARTHWALGIGVSNLPTPLANSFATVSELSSLWIGGGVGYRLTFSDITHVTIRAVYGVSLATFPFNYQVAGVQLYLDLEG